MWGTQWGPSRLLPREMPQPGGTGGSAALGRGSRSPPAASCSQGGRHHHPTLAASTAPERRQGPPRPQPSAHPPHPGKRRETQPPTSKPAAGGDAGLAGRPEGPGLGSGSPCTAGAADE